MSKGQRIKKARERPEKIMQTGLTTENYRILKWSAMLTVRTGIFGTMFYDVVGMNDTARNILEGVGYISVPLYSFLEVKAFHYTESRWKHLLKILLIGIISMIPFSMMHTGNPFSTDVQNACLTALTAYLCIWIGDRDFRKPFEKIFHGRKFLNLISFSTKGMIAGIGAVTCHFLNAENGLYAVPMIMLLDGAERCRHKKIVQALALAAWSGLMILSRNYTALTAVSALLPIYLLQDRKSLFSLKESRLNELLKIFEKIFYPACLWGMMAAKIIALIL